MTDDRTITTFARRLGAVKPDVARDATGMSQLARSLGKTAPPTFGEAAARSLRSNLGLGWMAYDLYKTWQAGEAAQAGTATDEQIEHLTDLAQWQERVEAAKEAGGQQEFNYYAGTLATQLPGDIATFLATLGGATAIKSAAGAGARKLLGKVTADAAEKAIQRSAQSGLRRFAGKATDIAVTEAIRSTISPRTYMQAFRETLPAIGIQDDNPDETALVLQASSKDFWDALPEAWANEAIEGLSERSGAVLSKLPPIAQLQQAQTAILAKFAKARGLDGNGMRRLLRAGNFHGMFEEVGEEYVGDVMRAATGLGEWSDLQKSWPEVGAMFAVFGAPGGMMALTDVARSLDPEKGGLDTTEPQRPSGVPTLAAEEGGMEFPAEGTPESGDVLSPVADSAKGDSGEAVQVAAAEPEAPTPGSEPDSRSAPVSRQKTSSAADLPQIRGTTVHDETGAPRVVYHGTRSDFDRFKPGETGGIFFTSDPAAAAGMFRRFGEEGGRAYQEGGRVIPAYLSLQNPLVDDYKGGDPAVEAGLIEKAKRLGHDGLVLGDDTYVVFDASQVVNALTPSPTPSSVETSLQEARDIERMLREDAEEMQRADLGEQADPSPAETQALEPAPPSEPTLNKPSAPIPEQAPTELKEFDLEAASYADLRTEAKRLGIKAKGKKEVLREAVRVARAEREQAAQEIVEESGPTEELQEGVTTAPLTATQGRLLDVQEGDAPGQVTIEDVTEAKPKRTAHRKRMAGIKSGEGAEATLGNFLRAHGGIAATGVEGPTLLERLSARETMAKPLPGLSSLVHPPESEKGRTWEAAIDLAHEAGYFVGPREDVTFDDLLDAIEGDALTAVGTTQQFELFAGTPPFRREESFGALGAAPVSENGGDALAETSFDSVRRVVQDFLAPVERWEGALKEEGVEVDVVTKARLWKGKAKARLDKLQDKFVKPMTTILAKADIGRQQLYDFLMARHAKERNAVIRTRDPNNDSGSGMTDAEADAILAKSTPELERIGRIWDRMNRQKLRDMVADGLISQEEANQLNEAYKHWAPLRTMDPAESAFQGHGSGLDIRGKEYKAALGRSTRADAPFEFGLGSYTAAIIRGEKNKVVREFYDQLAIAPDPSFARLDTAPTKRVLGSDGLVREVADRQAERADNVIGLKIDGKVHHIYLNEKYLSVASAFKRLGMDYGGKVSQVMGRFTRTLAGLSTRWNPVFPFFNSLRDLGHSMMVAGGEHGLATAARVVWDAGLFGTGKAGRTVFRELRKPGSVEGKYGDHYREYKDAGGPIAFLDLDTVQGRAKRIQSAIRDAKGASIVKWGKDVKAFIEDANDAVENATRFAAYVQLREQLGASVEEAALYAKDLTTNFETKGEIGPFLNSWWMFANAGIQGVARVGRALNHPGVRRLVYASMGFAVAMDFINAVLSDTDDDGFLYYDKIPEYEKATNFVLMTGWATGTPGDRIVIPLPFVFRWFNSVGTQVGAMMRGERSKTEAAGKLLVGALDELNPLGGGDSPAAILAPTVVDPFAEMIANRDFAGRQIMPTRFPGDTRFSSEMHWPDVSAPAKHITRTMEEMTRYEPGKAGAIDVSPEVLDHLAKFVTGGAGTTFGRLFDASVKANKGEEVELHNVPLLRRLFKRHSPYVDRRLFREHVSQVESVVRMVERTSERGQASEARELMADPLYSLREVTKRFKRDEAKLRKAMDLAGEAQKAEFEPRLNALYDGYNRMVREAKEMR